MNSNGPNLKLTCSNVQLWFANGDTEQNLGNIYSKLRLIFRRSSQMETTISYPEKPMNSSSGIMRPKSEKVPFCLYVTPNSWQRSRRNRWRLSTSWWKISQRKVSKDKGMCDDWSWYKLINTISVRWAIVDDALPVAYCHTDMNIEAANFAHLVDLHQRIGQVQQTCRSPDSLIAQQEHVLWWELVLLNLDWAGALLQADHGVAHFFFQNYELLQLFLLYLDHLHLRICRNELFALGMFEGLLWWDYKHCPFPMQGSQNVAEIMHFL